MKIPYLSSENFHIDVYDPSGKNKVTIINRYYPYYGGSVKTDGRAVANFDQPSGSGISHLSHVYNSAGQEGTYEDSYGEWGGTYCPYTSPLAVLGGVIPATYTTWIKAWWKWPSGTNGFGKAQESHEES